MNKRFYQTALAIVLICFIIVLLNDIFGIYTSDEICDKFLPSVVEIKICDENQVAVGNATGVVIGKDGLILTNRHVVRYYDYEASAYAMRNNISVRFYNETEYMTADIVYCAVDSDLALLKIDKSTRNYFKIGKADKLKYGDEVHTIGNGNGFGLAYAKGYVASPLVNVVYDETSVEAIQLSLNINEGNSGGPLINEKGQLIGITTFRLRDNRGDIIYGTCFALPVKTINAFLQSVN
ncbi:MAG: S1C family serine protease [Clostridiales bacterium]|jgi:S1-C subfamily serine protease|nr:S1C family serine protease [Clostridiales bacterium]